MNNSSVVVSVLFVAMFASSVSFAQVRQAEWLSAVPGEEAVHGNVPGNVCAMAADEKADDPPLDSELSGIGFSDIFPAKYWDRTTPPLKVDCLLTFAISKKRGESKITYDSAEALVRITGTYSDGDATHTVNHSETIKGRLSSGIVNFKETIHIPMYHNGKLRVAALKIKAAGFATYGHAAKSYIAVAKDIAIK